MEPRVIKTKKDHKIALIEVGRLISLDPEPGTSEADRLDLLVVLVENYEKEKFPIEKPGPIEAISFRMDEQGLKQRDLIPYIGSKSKVSEVLSRKRALTLPMIRALHEGLEISLEVLMQEPRLTESSEIEWDRFPLREMMKRGWISATSSEVRSNAKRLMEGFLSPLDGKRPGVVFCRRTVHGRSQRKMDRYALLAWAARVLIKANEQKITASYNPEAIDNEFLKEVAHLSWSEKGPLLAQEFLAKNGISLVIEPHLPRTHLDGAAVLSKKSKPVIGLTIRYDRLDNFWHTLLHELAHVHLHWKGEEELFVDDTEGNQTEDPIEIAADKLARESFVPRSVWRRSDAYVKRTPNAINELADKLRIHPAVVAGRIRHETKNYRQFNQLIGHGEVRNLFSNVEWS